MKRCEGSTINLRERQRLYTPLPFCGILSSINGCAESIGAGQTALGGSTEFPLHPANTVNGSNANIIKAVFRLCSS